MPFEMNVQTVAALCLAGCQALVDVDDYTFATASVGGAAVTAPDPGGVGTGRPGGSGGSRGSEEMGGSGGSRGAVGSGDAESPTQPSPQPPAQETGAEPSPDPSPGPSLEPAPTPDPAVVDEPLEPLAPLVAALGDLPPPSAGFLRASEVLVVGNPLRSRNGYVELRLERDGLLVIHQQANGSRSLAATFPLENAHLATLGDDGHFVVFARDGAVTDLSSNAGPVPGATLRVQNDGNVVLYDNDAILPRAVHWASGTNFPRGAPCGRLDPNRAVYPGDPQPLSSCNGSFRLVLDAEGRLTVVDPQNTPILQTANGGGPLAVAIMQPDGNLVVYDVDDVPHAASGTDGVPGAFAVLEDDGALAVLAPNGMHLWP